MTKSAFTAHKNDYKLIESEESKDFEFSRLKPDNSSIVGTVFYALGSGGYFMNDLDTGEKIEFGDNIYEFRYYDFQDITCIRTKGTVSKIEVDEKWWNAPKEGKDSRFIAVQGTDKIYYYYENGEFGTDIERHSSTETGIKNWDKDYVK